MENLLNYVLSSLLGYDYYVSPRELGVYTNRYQWTVVFSNQMRLIFDEHDVSVLRYMVATSSDTEYVERISKLLKYFV